MIEKKGRGFAGMDRTKQREIASKGGKAAHQKGTAHRFTSEEARVAGRKGGQAAHVKGTAHEFTPEEARIAGRKGGQAARGRQQVSAGEQATTARSSNPNASTGSNGYSSFNRTAEPMNAAVGPSDRHREQNT
jgi:general stress protein YciG